jgi:hypothetical protein
MTFSIGITTFSKRLHMVSKLISQIRETDEHKIILCVNGEKDGNFDEEYRKSILNLCIKYDNIYPVFFIEMRGLSKMWNTILNTSTDNNVLMLNDDLEICNDELFLHINSYINSINFSSLTKINNSFSHFLVKKDIINQVGYFDERLLGFGEEDGDITFRFQKNKIPIHNINLSGFVNIVSEIRHEHVKNGIGKYSKINRDYIYGEKYHADYTSEIKGMFDTPMKQVLEDVNCYPLEKYFLNKKQEV